MKNTVNRFGRTIASLLVGGSLMACALVAGTTSLVTVNLPHAVTVGTTTLPSGQYTISAMDMASGDDLFVIRSEKGTAVATVQAQKVILSTHVDKTQVVLSKDGDIWSIEQLQIEGDGVSYQFSK